MTAIAFRSVSARGKNGVARIFLRDVTFEWERGVFALLGTPNDGTSLLLSVGAGWTPVDRGSVRIFDEAPSPGRPRIAFVPRHPTLPEGLRVEEACALASELRDEPPLPVASRLEALGLSSLARRSTSSLTPSETRAVVLALALTSRADVLLIDEPLASLASPASSRVVSALRTRAAEGACVVVTTSSVRDATRLADRLSVLLAGALVPLSASIAHSGHGAASLRIVVANPEDASAFTRALAEDPVVTSIEHAPFGASEGTSNPIGLMVSGRALLEVASAVGRSSSATGIDVLTIESAVMPLAAIRASLSSSRST